MRQTISVCNQRLYMLCQLKRHGLSLNCLNLVFDSLIMSRFMYASPWSGYLNVECVSTIQKSFTKSVKRGVTSKSYQAADIFDVRDEQLFAAMCNYWSNHCLHHLLPSERDTATLDMILGVEDILISWFVIILAILGVASLFVYCMIHSKHLRLSDANKLSYLLTY